MRSRCSESRRRRDCAATETAAVGRSEYEGGGHAVRRSVEPRLFRTASESAHVSRRALVRKRSSSHHWSSRKNPSFCIETAGSAPTPRIQRLIRILHRLREYADLNRADRFLQVRARVHVDLL